MCEHAGVQMLVVCWQVEAEVGQQQRPGCEWAHMHSVGMDKRCEHTGVLILCMRRQVGIEMGQQQACLVRLADVVCHGKRVCLLGR